MAFSNKVGEVPVESLIRQSLNSSNEALFRILQRGQAETLEDFATLLSPAAGVHIEELAACSQELTQRNYGKTIRLFAPLYLSNECINICKYCGFSRNNAIERITLSMERVASEGRLLASQGFRSVLLVAGEHPKHVSGGYVSDCIKTILPMMPSVSIELAPMETPDYLPLVEAGAEMNVVYQETYHVSTYAKMHIAGPKKDYLWRMDTQERAYAAGFRRLGIGVLLGLHDWRYEAIMLAAHARHLLKHCWKAQVSISLPRLRPAAGSFQPDSALAVTDKAFVQLICALRLFLPPASIVISTRESERMRDGLIGLGITHMSAGASTEPGGYSAFNEDWQQTKPQAGEQFHITDERSPSVVAAKIRERSYEPVWKDFDLAFVEPKVSDDIACENEVAGV